MHSKRTRLDRFVSQHTGLPRKNVRQMIAKQELMIDGVHATNIHQLIDEFTQVMLNDTTLQNKKPIYIMMNKPIGVVSATKDATHVTVIDILRKSLNLYETQRLDVDNLHIVGRLDFNTSGLLLLTNNGRWSRQLTSPDAKIAKLYKVTLKNPINSDYIHAFAEGMYFPYEDITTRPATLEIVNDYTAMVTLVEGRYHQIKRMFGRFQNPVLELHRLAIGNLILDTKMKPGNWRELTAIDVNF